MEIGRHIRWRGRTYVLVGMEPTNVPERRAHLRDPESGEVVEAPFGELEPADEEPAADVSCSRC